jgi:hypothetical protein
MLFRTSLVTLGVIGFATMMAPKAAALPIYARQTNRMCSACHTQLLELNAMGRAFKLNGYRLSRIDSLLGKIEENNENGRTNLLLNLVSSVGVMAQSSYTLTKKAEPGTINGTAQLPQQLSLFVGGRLSPKMGAFTQLTYAPADGFKIDNIDIRYADSVSLFSKTAIVGFSLNNNPTVQDLWNSTPAWRFPWVGSSLAPTPAAVALVDGPLAQQVAGISALAMWNDHVYGEFGLYRSAPLGGTGLADSTATNTIQGVAPYWRAAITQTWPMNALMIGTYGMSANIIPAGVLDPTNRFTDVAFDFQDQIMLGGGNHLSLHGTWIHETQQWRAGGAANPTNTLNTYRADAIMHFGQAFAIGAGPFVTSGTSDTTLYAPASMTGSATGSPNSRGLLGELDVNLWENVRLVAQYVAYDKFNGAKFNYDGFGRDASDNNTLYLMTWLIF